MSTVRELRNALADLDDDVMVLIATPDIYHPIAILDYSHLGAVIIDVKLAEVPE